MTGTSSAGSSSRIQGGDDNPFVGPRQIQRGEPLYGRSAELRELYNRLQARRIVVLHSPSGAGKSSLVNAGLIPILDAAGYDVWKPIRVNLDPKGLAGVPEDANRYLLSAMASLEDELPAERRRRPAELARLDFLEYLKTRPRRASRADRSVVLIFDQFEEILTVQPLAVEARRVFFTAVGEALADERYWALFLIREDYLAAFAPYRDRIPTELSNTFRLDLLSLDGAREVAVKLAEKGGRSFPAADRLVRDLAAVHVQQPDGTFLTEEGVYVEPVQLQVVCRRLWQQMPADDRSIDAKDIETYGDVTRSLSAFYAEAVSGIAGGDLKTERTIREWIDRQLIAGGIRAQVRQEIDKTAGLDNRLVQKLLDSYLVRSEQRAGANWYELSHDRLVKPVQRDNETWAQAHLQPLQVQAKLWDDGRRSRSLLLGAEVLAGASKWAEDNPALLTETEREFLDQSSALRAEEARARTLRRVFTAALAGVAILAIAAMAVALVLRSEAVRAKATAEEAKRAAQAGRTQVLVAQAKNIKMQEDQIELTMRILTRQLVSEVAEGATWGQIKVDKRWVKILGVKDKLVVAARVMENGGRLLAAGHDHVLTHTNALGVPFLEVALHWLMGDNKQRKVRIVTMLPKEKRCLYRLEQLTENIRSVGGFPFDIDFDVPRPLDAAALADVGVLIVGNRWDPDFDADEIAAIDLFLKRGGGVLAVGLGGSWIEPNTDSPVRPLDRYPMNRLMSRYGVEWMPDSINSEALRNSDEPEKTSDAAVIEFDNKYPGDIDLYWVGAQGKEEYFGSLHAGDQAQFDTTLGHSWVIRRGADDTQLAATVVESTPWRVAIGK